MFLEEKAVNNKANPTKLLTRLNKKSKTPTMYYAEDHIGLDLGLPLTGYTGSAVGAKGASEQFVSDPNLYEANLRHLFWPEMAFNNPVGFKAQTRPALFNKHVFYGGMEQFSNKGVVFQRTVHVTHTSRPQMYVALELTQDKRNNYIYRHVLKAIATDLLYTSNLERESALYQVSIKKATILPVPQEIHGLDVSTKLAGGLFLTKNRRPPNSSGTTSCTRLRRSSLSTA